MKKSPRAGFTLLELILAVSISSIVLIGVFSIATSMVQFEVESGRKGSVTAWSLASLSSMNHEIAAGSTIEWPVNPGNSDDSLVVCQNWSRLMSPPNGARVSPNPPNPAVFYYCFDATNNVMRRMALGLPPSGGVNCPNVGVAPPACTAAAYGADSVIATAVYRNGAASAFTNDSAISSTVRIQYIVGNPAQGTVNNAGDTNTSYVNPQSLSFDTRVVLEN